MSSVCAGPPTWRGAPEGRGEGEPQRSQAVRVAGEGDIPDPRAAAAGEPCRGRGLPVIDNLGNWPGTMYLTPEQKIEYDADQAKYKEMHPNCEAHRWSMSGSRATHCGYCCPPIPMSPERYEKISQILTSSPRREEELDIWERTFDLRSRRRAKLAPHEPTPQLLGCVVRGVRADPRYRAPPQPPARSIRQAARVRRRRWRRHRERP